MPSFDAIVVGTGQAGPALAARLAGAGRKVAVVERGAFGGTCVNDGCTPTKTLIASAYAAHMARRGREYGLRSSGKVIVDMKREGAQGRGGAQFDHECREMDAGARACDGDSRPCALHGSQ